MSSGDGEDDDLGLGLGQEPHLGGGLFAAADDDDAAALDFVEGRKNTKFALALGHRNLHDGSARPGSMPGRRFSSWKDLVSSRRANEAAGSNLGTAGRKRIQPAPPDQTETALAIPSVRLRL